LARGLRRPSLALATSFVVLIGVATLLLALPMSLRRLGDVSLLDALFTATSAVCVTGLTVNDLGTTYTPFGQATLLVAIQLGGLGMMTIAAFALTLARGASLGDEAHMARVFGRAGLRDLRSLLRGILVATLAMELVGTLCLFALWHDDPRLAGTSVFWAALFHAVSAFCNAGMSLFPDGMVRFGSDGAVQVVLMVLIVAGGLGFPVWRELASLAVQRIRRWLEPTRPRPPRVSLTSSTALRTSALLLVFGALALLALEWTQGLSDRAPGDRVWAALFSSVTARTAGYATVDFAAFSDAGLLFVMVLMFIGGSPASMAGGVKTTTLAVVIATIEAELRGHEPRLGGRSLAPEVIRRATAVVVVSVLIVVGVTMLLAITERQPLRAVAFEAVSAFGTVGLTANLTPLLSDAGKLVVVLAMFLGRVGPLTVALAVGRDGTPMRHRLPPEELTIG
jgi:trk system potassium uptake protein TrkH